VAWFWEFVVLARKLIILSVSLFIWEPFLQSFVAVIVLIVSLSIQLFFAPFELLALNLLEVVSLASLLTTQLCGVLLWYKQQPGRTDGAELYQNGSVLLLFAVNGVVIAGFVLVCLWYLLKQKSKLIVQWMPFMLPLFDAVVDAEERLRWPNGSTLTREEELAVREEWSYVASQHEGKLFGRGLAHSTGKKVKKWVSEATNFVDRLQVPDEELEVVQRRAQVGAVVVGSAPPVQGTVPAPAPGTAIGPPPGLLDGTGRLTMNPCMVANAL
jgi:hypothetical protein